MSRFTLAAGVFFIMVLSACADGSGEGATTPPGDPSFQRHQPDLFSTFGAQPLAWADFDSDGDLDLFVGFGGEEANRLYRNDQGTFVDVASEVGLADVPETRAAAWGDYDGDGDLDLYVGFRLVPGTPNRLYRNDDRGARFVDVAREVGLELHGNTRQPAFVDYDGDGDVDLFVGSTWTRTATWTRSWPTRTATRTLSTATRAMGDSKRSLRSWA
jgi:hypothetical protein